MLRHEFQRQRLGGRPGQGASGRRQRPGLEIGEIGGERPKAVLPHPFLGEMLEGRDVVIGQNLGEPIAPVHRQDRRQGIELEGAAGQRIAGEGRGGFAHGLVLGSRPNNDRRLALSPAVICRSPLKSERKSRSDQRLAPPIRT